MSRAIQMTEEYEPPTFERQSLNDLAVALADEDRARQKLRRFAELYGAGDHHAGDRNVSDVASRVAGWPGGWVVRPWP